MVRPGGGSDPTPPCSRLVCRLPCPYRRAASVAERAYRALCSLVAQVPSTRRDLRCKVSRSRRICPASQLTCSRTHASPALGRRHLIGAMVNTRSISSSASAVSEKLPTPCRRPSASRTAGARGSPHVVGCGLRVCAGRRHIGGGRSGGRVRSPCRAAARRAGGRSVVSRRAEDGRGREGRW